MKDEEISEEMAALLAPTRPYAYVFAYTGGSHKSIQGWYSFFEVDHNHTGSVMNYFEDIKANPLVYCVLSGRMTPKQKQLVKKKGRRNDA